MSTFKLAAVSLAVLLGTTGAVAQPVVSVSPLNTGTWTVTQQGDGKYNVQLTRLSQFQFTNVTFTVAAATTERIRFVLVNTSDALANTFVNVRGPSTNERVRSVDSITKFQSGRVILQTLLVSEDIGADLTAPDVAIAVDQINSAGVLGDVLGNISLGDTGNLVSMTVGGALHGSVTVPQGSIESLLVTGAIATASGGPVSIQCRDALKILRAASINANIDTTYNSGTGDTLFLQTTSGGLSGSLVTQNILSPNVNEGLSIAGEINADITVKGPVKEVIAASSALQAGKTIKIGNSLIDDATDDGRITLRGRGRRGSP